MDFFVFVQYSSLREMWFYSEGFVLQLCEFLS